MTGCADKAWELQAFVDGELDAANAFAFEQHLTVCDGCSGELGHLHALRARLAAPNLRFEAPPELHLRVRAALAANAPRAVVRPIRSARRWTLVGAFGSLAAALAVVAIMLVPSSRVEDQLVASHVRSLLADHLLDVATSDRHVVKPWFNGKLDFAPPVFELAADGFPLAGGRLDYIDDRVVAALRLSTQSARDQRLRMAGDRCRSPGDRARRRLRAVALGAGWFAVLGGIGYRCDGSRDLPRRVRSTRGRAGTEQSHPTSRPELVSGAANPTCAHRPRRSSNSDRSCADSSAAASRCRLDLIRQRSGARTQGAV